MRVAVAGGGLAGLAAAVELSRSGAEVTVLEVGTRFGGQVHTERTGGFVIEHGAEGFIARSVAVRDLCNQLGLGERVVVQQTRRVLLGRDDTLADLPAGKAAGLLGIPAAVGDLGQGLCSLRGGMGELVDGMLAGLDGRANLRLGTAVVDVRDDSGGWFVQLGGGRAIGADAVVLALPPERVRQALPDLRDEDPGGPVGPPPHSILCVSLAFPREAIAHPLDASGVVFADPGVDRPTACTFSSSKFADRAPAGSHLLRVFFRPPEEKLPVKGDDLDAWVGRALEGLAPLGIRGCPTRVWSACWRSALPSHTPGHWERIAAWRARRERLAGLRLAGAFYDGPGVDGAIRSGIEAARSLLRGIRSS